MFLQITELHTEDPELAQTSVSYCSLMARYNTIMFQMCELQGDSLTAIDYSKQAMEWDKRGTSARKSREADILPNLIERLNRNEAIGKDLAGLT